MYYSTAKCIHIIIIIIYTENDTVGIYYLFKSILHYWSKDKICLIYKSVNNIRL